MPWMSGTRTCNALDLEFPRSPNDKEVSSSDVIKLSDPDFAKLREALCGTEGSIVQSTLSKRD